MHGLVLLSDRELLDGTIRLATAERACVSDLIEHLIEVERRKLYLEEACSSLSSYCIERLGHSEDEAGKRVRVTRLAACFPSVLEGLRSGAFHLSGLYLLAPYVTTENHSELLAEARGLSKRALEVLIARRFPKPDAPELLGPVPVQGTIDTIRPGAGATEIEATQDRGIRPGGAQSDPSQSGGAQINASQPDAPRMKPLSSNGWSVQFTATSEFAEKISRTLDLLSHSIPDRSLAELFERALDGLIDKEMKQRFGIGRSRKRRATASGSRYIPVDVARVVWFRDGNQCAFVDAQGRRCTRTRFLTIEHRHPFAVGGAATVENLCVYCSAHNGHTAVKTFGAAHIAAKRAARKARQLRRTRKRTAGEQLARSDERASPVRARPRTESANSDGALTAEPANSDGALTTERSNSDGALTAVQGALRTLGFTQAEIANVTVALGAMNVVREREALLRAALEMLSPGS